MRKHYPKYKKAQRPSFGDIPEHWSEKRFGFLFHFTKGLGITKENLLDEGIPCISYGEIHSRYGFEVSPEKHSLRCVSDEYIHTSPNSLLKHGDFIFADTSEDIEGSGNFTYYNSMQIAFAGYHTILNKPKGLDYNSRFLAYMFDSRSFRTQIQQEVTGTKVFSITKSILKDTMVLLPPPEEQKGIVNYLDARISKIDELIKKKKEFIERLNEKRTALISQVVTKGLPPEEAKKHGLPENPASKDSKYRWIEQISSNWTTEPLKRTVKTKITDGPHETPEILDDGVPLVSAEAVENGTINFNKVRGYISQEADENYSKKCKPQRNDLFIVKSGSTTGKIALVETDENFNIWSPIALVRLKDNYNPRFVFYALNSDYFQNQIRLFWSFGTQPNIGMGVIENLRIVVPTNLKEQQILASYLDARTKNLDSLIEKATEAIERLTEYRSTIITAAVTGKIDVRNTNP